MMISIRNEVEELERFHRLRQRAVDCYVTAIRNSAEYAIELEGHLTEPHRKHLQALADEVAGAGPDGVDDSRSTLRNLLRDYRDKASHYLNSIRDELSSTTRALEEIMTSLAQADGDSEQEVKSALARLREAPAITEVRPLRNLALEAANAIESSLEEARRQHDLTLAQFQAEIRVLHRRIDLLERAASVDALTELLRRNEIEQRIERGMENRCVLMIKTGGFHLAASRFHPDVAAELTGAFTKRLRNSLPQNAEIGRWGQEGFVAILNMPKAEAGKKAKWISEHLSGVYACLLDGKTVRPALQVSVALLDGNAISTRQMATRIGEFLSTE